MQDPTKPANPTHGDYERSDIGISGVLYFLVGLAVFGAVMMGIAIGLYHVLDKRSETQQAPVNALVTSAPADTRHIPNNYPQSAFPNPKLEEDERGQLNDIRLKEEQTLATYDYIDQKAGTVRIPIDRAMDLVAQRGLPMRTQSASSAAAASTSTTPPDQALIMKVSPPKPKAKGKKK
jgi:hypothetical protein